MTGWEFIYMTFYFRFVTTWLIQRQMLLHPGQQMSFSLPYVGAARITQTMELIYDIGRIGERSITLQ